jgi:hypothetical protein
VFASGPVAHLQQLYQELFFVVVKRGFFSKKIINRFFENLLSHEERV